MEFTSTLQSFLKVWRMGQLEKKYEQHEMIIILR